MLDKQNIQHKIDMYEHHNDAHKQTSKLAAKPAAKSAAMSAAMSADKLDDNINDKSLSVEQLQHQIDVLNDMIKADEASFIKHKAKADAKLKAKVKELDLVNLKLKEQQQEHRIGNLKLKELKRIIKQHKLKPVDAYQQDVHSSNAAHGHAQPTHSKHTVHAKLHDKTDRNDRNARNMTGVVIAGVSKTYDADNKQSAGKPIGSSKAPPIQLATLEWKSKAHNKSLHESMVDLRNDASDGFYKNDGVLGNYDNYANDVDHNTEHDAKSKRKRCRWLRQTV